MFKLQSSYLGGMAALKKTVGKTPKQVSLYWTSFGCETIGKNFIALQSDRIGCNAAAVDWLQRSGR